MRKKLLSFILAMCLLMTSLPVYGDVSTEMIEEDIFTDGSYESNRWFTIFKELLPSKAANGARFYMILDSLRGGDMKDQVGIALDSDSVRKARLAVYGLDKDSIFKIMDDYMDTFPATLTLMQDDLGGPAGNLYAALYHDNEMKYSDYMVEFNEYLNDLFSQLPGSLRYPISGWDDGRQGEIILYQSLLNILIRTTFGTETYLNNVFQSRELGLLSITDDVIANDLERYADGLGDITSSEEIEIEAYAIMFVDLGNVILESIEINLRAADALEDSNLLEDAFVLGKLINVITEDRTTSRRRPDPEPITITVNPDGETIYTNPVAGTIETSSMDFDAFLSGITSDVEWSVDRPDVVSIDDNGLVTITPAFLTQPTAPLVSVRVTAQIVDRDESDEVILLISSAEALGGATFLAPYISGYEDKTFREFNNITRAEAATMFARVLKLDIKEYKLDENGNFLLESNIPVPVYLAKTDFEVASFSDVDQNSWAYVYIEAANSNDLFDTLDVNKFNLNQVMTRAEIAVMISNAWEEFGIEDDLLAKHFISDVNSDHWAYDAINRVYNNGIVDGFDDNTFRPELPITRGQIVIMMNAILNRADYLLPDATFSDIPTDHKLYGEIESATRNQLSEQ